MYKPKMGSHEEEKIDKKSGRDQIKDIKKEEGITERIHLDNKPIHEPIHVISSREIMAGDSSSSAKTSHEGTDP